MHQRGKNLTEVLIVVMFYVLFVVYAADTQFVTVTNCEHGSGSSNLSYCAPMNECLSVSCNNETCYVLIDYLSTPILGDSTRTKTFVLTSYADSKCRTTVPDQLGMVSNSCDADNCCLTTIWASSTIYSAYYKFESTDKCPGNDFSVTQEPSSSPSEPPIAILSDDSKSNVYSFVTIKQFIDKRCNSNGYIKESCTQLNTCTQLMGSLYGVYAYSESHVYSLNTYNDSLCQSTPHVDLHIDFECSLPDNNMHPDYYDDDFSQKQPRCCENKQFKYPSFDGIDSKYFQISLHANCPPADPFEGGEVIPAAKVSKYVLASEYLDQTCEKDMNLNSCNILNVCFRYTGRDYGIYTYEKERDGTYTYKLTSYKDSDCKLLNKANPTPVHIDRCKPGRCCGNIDTEYSYKFTLSDYCPSNDFFNADDKGSLFDFDDLYEDHPATNSWFSTLSGLLSLIVIGLIVLTVVKKRRTLLGYRKVSIVELPDCEKIKSTYYQHRMYFEEGR